MNSFFIIKGLGRGFDGLLVEGRREAGNHLVEVLRVTNRDEIVGDRNVSFSVEPGTLMVAESCLEEIEDPGTREYDSANPHGRLLFEGRYTKGDLEAATAQFERCLQVTLTEKLRTHPTRSRTLFSGYFPSHLDRDVKNVIEGHFADVGDPQDLVFSLRAMMTDVMR